MLSTFLFLVFSLLCSFSLFGNEPEKETTDTNVVAVSNAASQKASPSVKNTWSPYFANVKQFEPRENFFFQTNIGIGFLRFSGVEGTTRVNTPGVPAQNSRYGVAPFEGHLTYNRTPLYEYDLGYQFFSWMKAALSYQYQGGLYVQTRWEGGSDGGGTYGFAFESLNANLALNAFMLKLYFELPYPMIVKNVLTSPYLAFGVGPGWQSWTNVTFPMIASDCDPLPLRSKNVANAVWMVDIGFRMRQAVPSDSFSVVAGCKYNQWGQARNIGKISQQGIPSRGLSQPFRVKTIYSFAPYLGVQWDFPVTRSSSSGNYTLKGRDPDVWFPYFARIPCLTLTPSIWTQFNAGIGFLYFNDVKGKINETVEIAATTVNQNSITGTNSYHKLRYNRTPLFEYLLGYQFTPYLKAGFSYSYQGGVNVSTQPEAGLGVTASGNTDVYAQLNANLMLNALMAKVYAELPFGMIFKGISTSPYVGVGVGPSWQTWSGTDQYLMGNYTTGGNTFFYSQPFPIRAKTSANVAFTVDMGLHLQEAYPSEHFSVMMGCKYMYWGHTGNIGKVSQQGIPARGLAFPFHARTVYSFAPYLGVQWNFPTTYTTTPPYTVNGRDPADWNLFFAHNRCFGSNRPLWTQFNAGIGFLYFSGVKGNIMMKFQTPALSGTFLNQTGQAPFKKTIRYNRSPLFEYLVGHDCFTWMSTALSYQHQANIAIATKPTLGLNTTGSRRGAYSQLAGNLEIDAIMAKVYFTVPYSLIGHGVRTSPYLALGVGPVWQSWTDLVMNNTDIINLAPAASFQNAPFRFRNKISASAAWMCDVGFRFTGAYPNSTFSITTGCKYNQWGQARNIGKISQQGATDFGLHNPFRIKTVYSFAPYLGAQWNF